MAGILAHEREGPVTRTCGPHTVETAHAEAGGRPAPDGPRRGGWAPGP